MPTTIARYPSPTFVLQGAVSDTDTQTAASYNTAIAESAAQRVDFLSQNLNGITEYGIIAAGTTTYTPAAFAAWQTYGRLQLDVQAAGASCTLNPPPSPKNGDIWDVVFPAYVNATFLANGKIVQPSATIVSGIGVPVSAPYFTHGTWRFIYTSASGLWTVAGTQAIAREGYLSRFSSLNYLGALPNALSGNVRTFTIGSSGGLYSFKANDTIFARLSGIHTRANAAVGADDNPISYAILIKRNGVTMAVMSNSFPNEERNRVMFSGYTSQVFPVALEVAYALAAPLDGVWTVESNWSIGGGGSQVVNPQRSYNLTTTCEVQRGCDF